MSGSEVPFWIVLTHWGSRSILFILGLLSIWSVATMIKCHRLLKRARGGEGSFDRLFESVRSGHPEMSAAENSLYWEVLKESVGYKEPARIDRSVRSLISLRKTEVEKNLTVLATLGANAPFIGLFGTVLGIIQAFGALGADQNTGASVMSAISEALIATAVGLFVAIPAVMAFNFFSRGLRVLLNNCEALRDRYIANLKG
ncbi:MAG: MotA/TolQ/ExbB proton channel family protein [Bdellovibrio sp.]|nr:MAG: MotA/TolQ/ExbB proton channel family protein [Bdellovibrio sp.]